MNTKDMDKIISAYEASEILRIPLSSLYYLSNTGKIRAIKIGRRWRYKKIDIEHYATYGTIGLNKEVARPRKEKRLSPRINCDILCEFRLGLPSQNHISKSIIKNIGTSGIFLNIYNPFSIRTDDPVQMRFGLDIPYEGNDETMEILGRVVRIADTGIGVKYRSLPLELREKITRYVGT